MIYTLCVRFNVLGFGRGGEIDQLNVLVGNMGHWTI